MNRETNETDKEKGTKKRKKTKADNSKQLDLPNSITCHSCQQICKVLRWGLFRLPAYGANVKKAFTVFSGFNTCFLIGFLLSVHW